MPDIANCLGMFWILIILFVTSMSSLLMDFSNLPFLDCKAIAQQSNLCSINNLAWKSNTSENSIIWLFGKACYGKII